MRVVVRVVLLGTLGLSGLAAAAAGRLPQAPAGADVYSALHAFALGGGSLDVSGLSLKRDRVEMSFTGTFHFAAPVENRVTGAVFVGRGTMRSETPPSAFEREHLRRMIGAEQVESDFETAVLRWTDDTYDRLTAAAGGGGGGAGTGGGQSRRLGAPPDEAARLAGEFEARFTRETGVNLAARLALSMVNGESPGLFFAEFGGGRRGRFDLILDAQNRVPVSSFGINAGEKGLIFAFQQPIYGPEVWTAFYSLDDYERRTAALAEANNLVDVTHYTLSIDLRDVRKIKVASRIDLTVGAGAVGAIPFRVGENLSTYQSQRLEKQLRVKAVRQGDRPLPWVQEDWEAGFTVFLPERAAAGSTLAVDVDLEGDYLQTNEAVARGAFYPTSNTAWLPRHGELDRATFDMTYLHLKRDRIASVGTRVSEAPDAADPDHTVTKYSMTHPVAFTTFAVGPFERQSQQVKWDAGGAPIPVEFSTVPSRIFAVSRDFILAELDNCVRYFHAFFGRYPYETFGATFHPYPFGQGFPTLLMIPPADRADRNTFAFIAHETAHQWWGNIVAWRSYQDQWLSEGFAEYSGILYTGQRDKAQSAAELIRDRRKDLLDPPRTTTGVGEGRLNDIGPLILGRRLNSTRTFGAYQALVYSKGAMVLRMLHFLLSDPATLHDAAFVAMMTDFVSRFRNGAASTQNFAQVASAHFAQSPIGQKYGLRDLAWFFNQWVFASHLPSYTMEYALVDDADGSVIVSGTIRQENVPDQWLMVLPVVATLDGGQVARTTVSVRGSGSTFQFKVPSRPSRVELDPDSWVLSEKTETHRK
jgi:hypothetical protein